MIGKLKGRLDSTQEAAAIVDVGGVGYHVFCTSRTLAAMPGIGEAVSLIIETHVREDHIHLFGFPDENERDWFRLLLGVQGVGVKMALAILSALAPAQIAQAIAAKDVKSLTRISGVGPKLAERLTTELKGKVGKMATALPVVGASRGALPPASANEDAISALVNLGYARAQAYGAVQAASQTLNGDDAIDNLIKESLRQLAR